MKKKILLFLILLSFLIETSKQTDATDSIITTISGPSTGFVNQPLTYNLTVTSTIPNTLSSTVFSASWIDGYSLVGDIPVPLRYTQDMLLSRSSTLCTHNSDYSIVNCAVTFTPTAATMYRLGVNAADGTNYCSFTNRDTCPFGGAGSYYNIGSCGPSSCQLLNISNPQLTVNKVGLGTVTSSPSGINCGTTCNYTYNYGDVVTLTATADTGYTFSSWSGCSTSTSSTITVTMDAVKTCTATFIIVEAPTISSLQIGNNSNRVAGFTSTLNASGLQSTQRGKGWYNPMTITLNATKGTGDITTYYVAFYNSPSLLSSSIVTSFPAIPVAALTNLAVNDYFVLKYTSAGRYSVWDPNTSSWYDITGESSLGKQICASATCTAANLYYTAYPGDSLNKLTPDPGLARSWTILLDKNFLSKTLHTAVSVVDNNGLSAFNANIDPVYP